MEKYSFFDSTLEDERNYSSDEFADYFRQFIGNGVFNGGNNLQVICDNSNMQTKIKEGYAWINGYLYNVCDEPLALTHDAADITNDRIDRIVIRLDKSLENRYVRAFILKGEASESPQPPSITREKNIYELSLAQVRIIAGKSYIESSQITDDRLDTNVCGIVNSLIQADTTEIFNQFQAFLNEKKIEYPEQWKAWFDFVTNNYENQVSVWLETLKTRISETDVTRIDQSIIDLEKKTQDDGIYFAKLNAWN